MSDAGNRIFGRIIQTIEQLPKVSYVTSTGFSTTSSTALPITGLEIITAVPAGAVIDAVTFLDCIPDAGVTNVGTLWTWAPSQSTYQASTATAEVIYTQEAAVADRRATVGQQWVLPNPERGRWGFQVRLARFGGAASAAVSNNCSFKVTVL